MTNAESAADSENYLRGRRAFVAGASRGIGLASARALARMGASVFLAARNTESLQQARESLAGEGHGLLAADLSSPAGCRALESALDEWGPPHIVVANLYARRPAASVHRLGGEELAASIRENLDYLTHILPAALVAQKEAGFGRWIAVSSAVNRRGGPGQGLYSAQKSALEALMRTIAVENGRHGITANTVSPGFMETPGTREGYDEERRAALAEMNLLKRAGRPEEAAHAVAFLASPLSGFITGVNLPVCGGHDLGWPLVDLARSKQEQ